VRILLAVRWPVGGIRTFFQYVYGDVRFKEFSFTIIAPGTDFNEFLRNKAGFEKYTYIACGEQTSGFLLKVRETISKNNFDIIHSHGFTSGVAAQVSFPRHSSSHHIMTAHDVLLRSQFRGLKGVLKRILLTYVFNRLDLIHTVTKSASENIAEILPGINRKKLYPIFHGIDTAYFLSGRPTDLRSQLNLDDKTFLIGFFGRFMPQKGFDTLMDAVGRITKENFPYNFKILTYGWGGYVREYYLAIKERGLERFFVQMPHSNDMPSILSSMDLVVMPSRWEACGLLAMESLTAGTPIIGSSCVGLKDVLEDTPARVITPGDSFSLAEAIKGEIKAPRKDEFFSYKSLAASRYSIDRPIREILKLYKHSI